MRPKVKAHLPPEILAARARWWSYISTKGLPRDANGYERRSERAEAVNALVEFMLPRMDVLSYRVGRPDRRDPGRFIGFAVDWDIAPETNIPETRLELAIATMKDLGWLDWDRADAGGRKTKAGFVRQSSQQVEENESGELRGRAAIRQLTDEFFKIIEFDRVMAKVRRERYEKLKADAAKQRQGVKRTRVARTVAALVESLSLPPETRERPPP